MMSTDNLITAFDCTKFSSMSPGHNYYYYTYKIGYQYNHPLLYLASIELSNFVTKKQNQALHHFTILDMDV